MFVHEVYADFIALIEEDALSYVDLPTAQLWLRFGHERYRNEITQLNPEAFAANNATITLANEASYDLADTGNPVVLKGPDAGLTDNRLVKLVRVITLDVNGDPGGHFYWNAVTHGEDLQAIDDSWMMFGSQLLLSRKYTGDLTLQYVTSGATEVDWTKTTAGDDEWIDDYVGFHDVISLLAYDHYVRKAGADEINVKVLADQERRLEELRAHIRREHVKNRRMVRQTRRY